MIVIVFIVLLCGLLYYYGTRNFNYWSDRNVPHNKPIPFFGNNFKNYMQLVSRSDDAAALYRQFPNEPFVGFYKGLTPQLHIRDPDIIRSILTVDFQNFYERGLGRDPKVEPLLDNLFHVDGDEWKLLRQRLTPAFTSGKLKGMFPLIVECAEQLQQLAERKADSGKPYDVRELMARYTTDFIGACGFGIKMNSINDSSSEFRDMGRKIFDSRFKDGLRLLLKDLFPNFFSNIKVMPKSLEGSLVNIVRTILEQRNHTPIGRNDFIDLMMDLKNQGKIFTESLELRNEDGKPKTVEREVDFMLIVAQCFIFFAAGFETSSSATSYTLHQLAYNQEVQATAQKEVDRVLAKYDNKLCYDAVKEMTYLECTFKEGLRMFPSLGVLNRTCTRKYQIPGTKIWIDKGVKIIIPVAALHMDEKYYTNPEEFNPSRFLPDSGEDRHKFAYLPFGEGPRACVGLRLGLMQSMAGLAALLHRFSVEPAPITAGGRRNVVVNPASNVVQSVRGGLPLILKKRNI